MKILFITRAYPPVIGGMEKFSYKVTTEVSKLTPSIILANKKGKKNLIIFFFYALFKSLYLIKKEKIDRVHLGDPVLSPIGIIIKLFYKKPIIVTLHGLDITYSNKIYQMIIPNLLKKFDKYICISNATKKEATKIGLYSSKCVVIPVGVEDNLYIGKSKKYSLKKLEKELRLKLDSKKLILSVGHLVKRKGFNWFIRNVLPQLDKDYFYLVIGDFGYQSKGDEKEKIEKSIKELGLNDRVFLAGKVSDDILKLAYNAADLFVMPNIHVKNDLEGFGMVAIEAASCRIPVVASKLEGIEDAIIDGKNGLLVKPEDKNDFVRKINLLNKKGKNFGRLARNFTLKEYDWSSIAKKYLNEFKNV